MSATSSMPFVFNGKTYPRSGDGVKFDDPRVIEQLARISREPDASQLHAPTPKKSLGVRSSEFMTRLGVLLEASTTTGPPASAYNSGFNPFGDGNHRTR